MKLLIKLDRQKIKKILHTIFWRQLSHESSSKIPQDGINHSRVSHTPF